MGACAAVLDKWVVPCAVILCMLRQCANNKDDYNEDDNNNTCWTQAEEQVLKCVTISNCCIIWSSTSIL